MPIRLDDGGYAHFEGHRVQHNLSRGPGKGGLRIAAYLIGCSRVLEAHAMRGLYL